MSNLFRVFSFQSEQGPGGNWSKSERLASLASAYYYLGAWALINAIQGGQMYQPRKEPKEGHCYHWYSLLVLMWSLWGIKKSANCGENCKLPSITIENVLTKNKISTCPLERNIISYNGRTNNKESVWTKQKHWLKAGGHSWAKWHSLGL